MNKIIAFLILTMTSLSNAADIQCSDGWFDLQATVLTNEALENVVVINKYGVVVSSSYVKDSNNNQHNRPPYWFVLPTDQDKCFGKRTLVFGVSLNEVQQDEKFSANLLCGSSASRLTCQKKPIRFMHHSFSTQACWECTDDGEVCWAVPCE